MEASESTIRHLREMVKAACSEHPHLTSRLEKAAFLVLLRRIRRLKGERYGVGSEDGLREYHIINGHCDCADYVRHGAGHPCKHRLALMLSKRLGDVTPTLGHERLDGESQKLAS